MKLVVELIMYVIVASGEPHRFKLDTFDTRDACMAAQFKQRENNAVAQDVVFTCEARLQKES